MQENQEYQMREQERQAPRLAILWDRMQHECKEILVRSSVSTNLIFTLSRKSPDECRIKLILHMAKEDTWQETAQQEQGDLG